MQHCLLCSNAYCATIHADLQCSTDFVIVCIPLPLLWTVKLSIKRKLIIGVLLCSGVFIMIATLLRCILSLRDIEGINTSTIWAIRETVNLPTLLLRNPHSSNFANSSQFVGIIAVNAAAIKPLFSASRWIASSKGSSGNYKSSNYAANKYGHPLSNIGGSGAHPSLSSNRHRKMMTDLGENSSEEHIVQKPDYKGFQSDVRAASTNSESSHQNGIMVTREYEVSPGKSTLDV